MAKGGITPVFLPTSAPAPASPLTDLRIMSLSQLESVSLPVDFHAFDDIIDVRTPLEFEEDHLPGARNLPVLTNEQRVEVGTLYRQSPFRARKLGARYVSESISTHLAGPLSEHQPGWNPLVYCWRGGQRSAALATVLRSIGWRARTLEGGYKAYRRYVMGELGRQLSDSTLRFRIISGLTGVGKTRLLETLQTKGLQVIDLEAMANHRGSLLGSTGTQPTQRQFENRLHQALSRLDLARPVFAEAESSRIGNVYLPPALWQKFSCSQVIEITMPISERVRLLLEDYRHFLENPETLSGLLDPLSRLRGRARVQEWQALITEGAWPEFVTSVLENHYDLCYRRPGSSESNYQVPVKQLSVPDCSPESYLEVASQLVEFGESPAS